MGDEELFFKAKQEINDGTKDSATWAKAMAMADGDNEAANHEYVRLRVDSFRENDESSPNSRTPRPWVRFWARFFDIYLFGVVAGTTLEFIAPELIEKSNDTMVGVILIFFWIFVESILMSVSGTTPGKAFLRTHVKKSDGSPIEMNEALSRSFRVWWRGMGIGAPFISLITLTIAYRRLKEEGVTTWDKDTGFVVTHGEIGWVRILLMIAFFLGFIGLVIVGLTMEG